MRKCLSTSLFFSPHSTLFFSSESDVCQFDPSPNAAQADWARIREGADGAAEWAEARRYAAEAAEASIEAARAKKAGADADAADKKPKKKKTDNKKSKEEL